MRGSPGIAAVLVLTSCLVSATARANPDIDEGRRLLGDADFDGAGAALARADDATSLSRAELVQLLESWALLHRATDDATAMHDDIARLAALDPTHHFAADVPPEVTEAFAAAVEARTGDLALDVSARIDGRSVSVDGALRDDAGVVRRVEVHARAGGGAWSLGVGHLTLAALDPVDYWAQAIGPGGAVVATRGSAEAPLVLHVEGASTAPVAAHGSDSTLFWGLVVGGSVLAVTVIVILAVVLSSGGGQYLDGPHVLS